MKRKVAFIAITSSLLISGYATANYEKANLEFYDSYESGQYKESNHSFQCKSGSVLVGRRHSGDENGATWYSCSKVLANGTPIILKEKYTSPPIKESWSNFTCPAGAVMTGRSHQGDENKNTIYTCHYAYSDNDQPVMLVEQSAVGPQNESKSHFDSRTYEKIINGRKHDYDENGDTWMYFSGLSINTIEPEPEPDYLTLKIKNNLSNTLDYQMLLIDKDYQSLNVSGEIKPNSSYTSQALFEPRNNENIPQSIELKVGEKLIQQFCNVLYTKNGGSISISDNCGNVDVEQSGSKEATVNVN
jgi:hypothetical protein